MDSKGKLGDSNYGLIQSQESFTKTLSDEKFQTILGWGGAFTDSAGINIDSLDVEAQDLLIRLIFILNDCPNHLLNVQLYCRLKHLLNSSVTSCLMPP
jgi:glucosylceramidase